MRNITIFHHIGRVVSTMAVLLFLAARLSAGTIHDAATRGDADLLKSLLSNNPGLIESRNARNATPLYCASLAGQTDVVRLLISRGADVNAATPDGLASIHWAALRGYTPIVRMLLDAGARADARSTVQANTPLIETWSENQAQAAEVLLQHGADINAAENWYGWTTLHFAAYRCCRELMGVLLAHHADVSLRDRQGRTALHIAAQNGCPASVKMLLDAGADPAARDNAGKTPAEMTGSEEIVRMIATFKPLARPVPAQPSMGAPVIR